MAWDIGADEWTTSTPTVSPNDATHGHNADNVSLTVTGAPGDWDIGADQWSSTPTPGVVSPNDAAHVFSGANVTISTLNTPTGVSAVSDSLTSIAVSWTDTNAGAAAYRVYVDGARVAQTAVGDTSFTVEWLAEGSYTIGVSAFDATSETQTADVVGWTVVTLLTADTLHAHSADNVTLTTSATTVVPADATHAHTADNVTLDVTTVSVVPADATHAHTADNANVYDTTVFSAATDLVLTVVADQITATWTDTNGGSYAYRVYYMRPGVDADFTLDSETNAGAETAVIKYLATGTDYTVKVAPYDSPTLGPGVEDTATTGSVMVFSSR